MIKILLTSVFIFLLSFSLKSQDSEIAIYSFEDFKPLMEQENDTTYVINFWATWCKPCVEELPYFESVNNEMLSKKVKVILVSLDDIDNLESKVIPFIKKMDLKSELLLLNDVNYNAWIDKVDASWSGAIPATLIYNKSHRSFYEKSFELQELKDIINKNRIKS